MECNAAFPHFGKCGDSLNFRMEDGVLHIEGTGRMYDFLGEAESWILGDSRGTDGIWEGVYFQPFDDHDLTFEKAVIAPGCTYIGSRVFELRDDVKSVFIPDTVTEIGRLAFYCCESLEELVIPDSVVKIGDGAFAGIPHIIYHGPAQSDDNWGALRRN